MANDFDIMGFHRAKAAALVDAPGLTARAFRLALAHTIPARVMVVAPRLAVALLSFLDEPDTTQAERDTLTGMPGRSLAPLFDLDRFPPSAFLSIGGARDTIREWLRPHVTDHLDFHRRQDEARRRVMAARRVDARAPVAKRIGLYGIKPDPYEVRIKDNTARVVIFTIEAPSYRAGNAIVRALRELDRQHGTIF